MRTLLLSTAIFIASGLAAQDRFCGATDVQNEWFSQHPELKAKFEALQEQAVAKDKEFMSNHSQQRPASAASYTIPIVFHILHLGGSENISDAQVQDAVSILNRDYRKLNPDTASVVTSFKALIGDAKFQFQLATIDPNGNCTNGIVRHWDTRTNWTSANFPDYVYTWNPAKYLNVYVVKTMSGNAAGYTFLPGSGVPTNGDAVVILSGYVGSIGTGGTYTSRALTHEVGHWFNLPHTWGGTNQPGVACGDDGVSDTPVTKGFSSCSLNNAIVCTSGVVENVQNYMDYSYCSRMFTLGQVNRMQTAAASNINSRNNLSTSTNLANTGLTNPLTNCIPELDMSAPSLTVCSGSSLAFSTFTFNANPTAYVWSADNGATVTSTTTTGATILFSNTGITNVTCLVSNTNGNNSKSIAVTVLNGAAQVITSNFEGFENGVIPPMWDVVNATTPLTTWDISQEASHQGLRSVYVKGDDALPNGIELLETPSFDFKNNQGSLFTFYYAYAKFSANNKDVFKVQATKDCGGTWTDIWTPSNTTLANSSAGTTSVILLPSPQQWVMYDVTGNPYFSPFLDEANVRIRFYFQEDVNGPGNGNRIYLDDINFSTPVGINELTQSIGFKVYPNPSEAAFNVNFTLANTAKIKYQVVSVTGALMLEQPEKTYNAGSHELKVNENNTLSKGIYFLNLEMNGTTMSKKLLVN